MSSEGMTRWTWLGLALGVFTGLTSADEPPPINRLEGVVVSQEDGQPVAGVPVGVASRKRGYLIFNDEGLRTHGEQDLVFGMFPKRNGRHSCQTVTDAAGRFVLENFAAPDDTWMIAAGDAQHGHAIEASFKPEDFRSKPLRLELQRPGHILLSPPKTPKGVRLFTSIGLVDSDARQDADAAVTGDAEPLSERIRYYASMELGEGTTRPQRIGPLPGGHRYKVSVQGYGNNLPYAALLFERVITVEPNGTAEAAFESDGGLIVSGRVTGSDDKPLDKVNVKVKTADGTLIGGVSDAEGKYELHGVPPGTHTLELLRHAKRTAPG
ncbi:MAG: carboxypeptidase regulatory-like domain-containing protein [Phycisphaerae bacterium]|nr:carboxypeptidase regulatory-like domain-containing protein [Phycisphaerae bacterium]